MLLMAFFLPVSTFIHAESVAPDAISIEADEMVRPAGSTTEMERVPSTTVSPAGLGAPEATVVVSSVPLGSHL